MKIAVIGCGSIGERHSINLEGLGHTVDRFDPVRFPRKSPYDVISGSDAVVIASPTSMHDDYMEEAVRHGKPFFVEKPIADNLLGSVVEDAKKAVMCGYNLRWHSCVKRAKKWLDAGFIGEPIWANFTLGQYNDRPPYLRDGVVLNFASHEIDAAYYLLGKAKVLCATTQTVDGYEMMTDFVLEHESGCRSSNHTDYITIPEQRYFTITGDKGRLFVNVVDRIASLMVDSKWVDSFTGADTWNQNYISEMQAFLDRIDGKETIGATGEDGLHVLELCLDIKRLSGL